MSGPIPVFEAVEWREPAPGGGSQAQIFRLYDGRFVVVKFPENQQGERVLANEFLSCQLAELFNLPVNRSVLVSIDERLLRLPREQGRVPAAFSAGIRCGMIRFENAQSAQAPEILKECKNSAELHSVGVFEQLVCRQDGRQLLMHHCDGDASMLFGAFDYGYSFGGQPAWSVASLGALAAPILPTIDPFSGNAYTSRTELSGVIEALRSVTAGQIADFFNRIHPPRWGVTVDELLVLGNTVLGRAQSLVAQFDGKYPRQLTII
jgi:hypothetical protein